MKYKLIIFFIIIIGQTISAQNTIKDSTLTLYDNIEWLNNFESQVLKSNKIELIKQAEAAALFGEQAKCGVLILKTKNKQLIKKVKQIL